MSVTMHIMIHDRTMVAHAGTWGLGKKDVILKSEHSLLEHLMDGWMNGWMEIPRCFPLRAFGLTPGTVAGLRAAPLDKYQ